ncbi:hypothetical protein [Sinorhizobium meliloti]|uniref:hypothetical protein n=1 Tax=Rhizobium meliloti TaxID=382 RepID=UPI000FD9B21B|nr:hypothetical protein [Sinorhizobium meliloti]RVP95281.1 hypothetical protein CN070_28360 [Sinorhizobium meliloti]
MADRGPTVVNTGGSGAGWAVAAIVVLFIVGALFLFGGELFDGSGGGGGNTNVDVTVPNVEAPQAPSGGEGTQAPAGGQGTQAPPGGTQQ